MSAEARTLLGSHRGTFSSTAEALAGMEQLAKASARDAPASRNCPSASLQALWETRGLAAE